jgi:hypothetical protein
MHKKRIELLEFEVRFVSRESVPFASIPPSKRSFTDRPPPLVDDQPTPRVVTDVYMCIVMEPVEQSSLNGSRVFDRRLRLRPLVELPSLNPNEMWLLQISFPDFLKLPIALIAPLEI